MAPLFFRTHRLPRGGARDLPAKVQGALRGRVPENDYTTATSKNQIHFDNGKNKFAVRRAGI
ncbi:hypothetical protein [Beduinella massiliensis]|uniref:hypothetical protein n=1 Tax=Beduinella massiliensis TaxID=1852363 RepID=UPI0011AF4395